MKEAAKRSRKQKKKPHRKLVSFMGCAPTSTVRQTDGVTATAKDIAI